MDWLLIAIVLFVAFCNGANDNFKGFATVWGSDTLSYRQALGLATTATITGSLLALFFAEALVLHFSGKGLVPDVVASAPVFLISVAGGAAVTICLATTLGFPISTTHALIGGLIGAGLAQSGGEFHFDQLASAFLLPLLLSPLVAVALGALAYRLFRIWPSENECVCLVAPPQILTLPTPGATDRTEVTWLATPNLVVAPAAACERLAAPFRFSVSRNMDRVHILSAMSICFARAVNDTPKLAALLMTAQMVQSSTSIILISLAMALGGLLFARRVAQTMSRRVTRMNHTQGLAANLITASLVLFASKFGLPVSTTHVSVGAIAGVGASAKTLNWPMLRNILLSWLATLPLAASVAWLLASA